MGLKLQGEWHHQELTCSLHGASDLINNQSSLCVCVISLWMFVFCDYLLLWEHSWFVFVCRRESAVGWCILVNVGGCRFVLLYLWGPISVWNNQCEDLLAGLVLGWCKGSCCSSQFIHEDLNHSILLMMLNTFLFCSWWNDSFFNMCRNLRTKINPVLSIICVKGQIVLCNKPRWAWQVLC